MQTREAPDLWWLHKNKNCAFHFPAICTSINAIENKLFLVKLKSQKSQLIWVIVSKRNINIKRKEASQETEIDIKNVNVVTQVISKK